MKVSRQAANVERVQVVADLVVNNETDYPLIVEDLQISLDDQYCYNVTLFP